MTGEMHLGHQTALIAVQDTRPEQVSRDLTEMGGDGMDVLPSPVEVQHQSLHDLLQPGLVVGGECESVLALHRNGISFAAVDA